MARSTGSRSPWRFPTGQVTPKLSTPLARSPGNQRVEVTFPGYPVAPRSFTIRGVERTPGAPTSFSGLVFDNAEQPIQGAEIEVIIGGQLIASATSDLDGRYFIADLERAGAAGLRVKGEPAFHVGGPGGRDVPPGTFPNLLYMPVIIPNVENTLPFPVPLPEMDRPTSSPTTRTTPRIWFSRWRDRGGGVHRERGDTGTRS